MSSQPEGSQPRSDAVGWWATPGVGRPAVDIAESTRAVLEAFDCGADLRPLGSQLVGLREVIDQLEAVFVRGAAEFDRLGGPADDGHGSLASWLRQHCRLMPAEAQARARLASRVGGGGLSMTAEAMDAGTVSWRHADVVERTLRDVPKERRTEAE